MNPKLAARLKRRQRIRRKISGSEARPRLSVFRSARHIYAQIIDDGKGQTLVAASTLSGEIKDKLSGLKKAATASSITAGSRPWPKAAGNMDWSSS
jgi:large subunit ribosomal protein L18